MLKSKLRGVKPERRSIVPLCIDSCNNIKNEAFRFNVKLVLIITRCQISYILSMRSHLSPSKGM